jgi:hypothetical protein
MSVIEQMDNTPSQDRSRNPIAWLIREAHAHRDAGDFVALLESQLRTSAYAPEELEHMVGSLRIAVQRHLGEKASCGPASRCNFCGRPRDKVDALLVSAEGAMCDDCAVLVLESISRARGQAYLRIAFFFFRTIASIGRVFHDIRRGHWKEPTAPSKSPK